MTQLSSESAQADDDKPTAGPARTLDGRGPEVSLRLVLPAEWEMIESVRSSVSHAASALAMPPDAQDAVGMVAAELLENAVKHGAPEGVVRFHLEIDAGSVVIQVVNEQAAAGGGAALSAIIEWINTYSDPFEAYTERMREVLETRGALGGLGLVRVACEGGARLSCRLAEAERGLPSTITVMARMSRGLQ